MKTIEHLSALGLSVMMATLVAGAAGCGTTVGNPQTGDVNLKNKPYNNSGAAPASWFAMTEAFPLAPVSEFKFCNTKLKLVSADGGLVGGDSGGSVEVTLGLIDVSDATADTFWGTVSIPVGFELAKLNVELHHDSEKCSGAPYSLRYNGTELTADLEFQFKFDPPVAVDSGDVLALGLTPIATAIENADQAGELTNELIQSYLENAAGTGEEQ